MGNRDLRLKYLKVGDRHLLLKHLSMVKTPTSQVPQMGNRHLHLKHLKVGNRDMPLKYLMVGNRHLPLKYIEVGETCISQMAQGG